jgi:hypothetical protein
VTVLSSAERAPRMRKRSMAAAVIGRDEVVTVVHHLQRVYG